MARAAGTGAGGYRNTRAGVPRQTSNVAAGSARRTRSIARVFHDPEPCSGVSPEAPTHQLPPITPVTIVMTVPSVVAVHIRPAVIRITVVRSAVGVRVGRYVDRSADTDSDSNPCLGGSHHRYGCQDQRRDSEFSQHRFLPPSSIRLTHVLAARIHGDPARRIEWNQSAGSHKRAARDR